MSKRHDQKILIPAKENAPIFNSSYKRLKLTKQEFRFENKEVKIRVPTFAKWNFKAFFTSKQSFKQWLNN